MSQPPSQPYPGQPHPDQPQQGQSFPGPAYGQPYPGQSSGAPAGYPPPAPYGSQPAYQAPGFPPPGGAGQQFPGAYPPPPQKKSNALKIVLIVVAVVLVICIGGVVAVVMASKDAVDNAVQAARSSANPTTTTAAPTTAPEKVATITLADPAKLGGRPRITDPQFADAAEGLKDALAEAPGATDSVGGLWGEPADRDIVMVAAATASVTNPERELNSTIMGAGVGGLKLTGLAEVDPGPLGGSAKCGNSNADGVKLAVCVWADNGSVGMIAWYFKSVDKVKGEFVKLRGQIEKSA
jgi:hypothetical protein